MPIDRHFKPIQGLLFPAQQITPQKAEKPKKGRRKPKEKDIPPKKDSFTDLLEKRCGQDWVAEHKFHPVRKWRMDYACPALKICIEIDGGIFIGGRHSRPIGMLKDNEKFNTAASMGWVVLKFTPQQKNKFETFDIVTETIRERLKEIKGAD